MFVVNIEHELKLDRFYVRHLTLDDVNDNYLSWFKETNVKSFIDYAKSPVSKELLSDYVRKKNESDSTLFLGVFSKSDDFHIGNIKFEPIDLAHKSAEMGILIGTRSWRGKGVGPEVILGCGSWLRDNLGLEKMHLGVSTLNEMAFKAYQKIGFCIDEDSHEHTSNDSARMTLLLSEIT